MGSSQGPAAPRAPTREIAAGVLVAAAYGVVTRLGLLFVAPPDRVSYFWPASGFLLAALALAPPERWRALLAIIFPTGVLLNAWWTDRGLVASLGFALADVLEVWPAAWLLVRFGGARPDFGSVRQVLALSLAAAPSGALLSALLGAAIVTRGGAEGGFFAVFRTWATSVVISEIVVTPLLVVWGRQGRGLTRRMLVETAALVGLLGAVTFVVFGLPMPGLQLLYLPFPFVFLAAVRFGPRGASLASFVVAVIVLLLAARGVSPLVSISSTSMRVHWMQLLVGTMSVSSLALAAAMVEQRGTAARLREAEERYRLVVEAAPIGVVLAQADGTIAFANPAFAAIVGRPLSEVIGRPLEALTHPDDRARSLEVLRSLVSGERDRILLEKRYVRPDGAAVATLLHVAVLRDEAGRFSSTISMVEDVSDRKRLEAHLLQSQKVEAVGRLAGGVAHDFNNILTVILAQATIGSRAAKEPRVIGALGDIADAARRAAGLTRQLLAFARKQVVEPKVVELDALLGELMNLLRRLVAEDVEIRFEPGGGRWPVKIDPSQLEQIVVNLAVNARDAMPDGGALTIATQNRTVALPGDGDPDVEPGDWTVLTLTDTGVGMDDAVLRHLFEPFFTTKERGKGTGLGLATVHGIVTQAGGHIAVSSSPGQGSTFRVWLPRAAEAAEPPSSEVGAGRGGGETVLLVEDEPAVRVVAAEVLRSNGYVVLAAHNADAALELSRAHAGHIELLLTDVVMPGKSGRALADELRRERPTIRLLFTSGYTDDHIARHGVLDEGTSFLPKPYTPANLVEKVQQVLRSTGKLRVVR